MSEELNRLRWRCQRGMLELDHILRGFLECGYAEASLETRYTFEKLLEYEDADLFDLIMGRIAPPSEAAARVLGALRRVG